VQESMNQMIEAGKEIPGAEEDECSSLCHQRPSHNEDLLLQVRGIPFVVLTVLGYFLLLPHVQIC
jgi:hypothetical protein